MAGVNKVILVGNLGHDPEMRYTKSSMAVANMSLATAETSGKGNDRKEYTEWHKVVAWDKLAEVCNEYLGKGSQIYVEGSLRTREWQDKEGNKRFTTEIHARTIQFLGSKGDKKEIPVKTDGVVDIEDIDKISDDFFNDDEEVPF